MIANTEVFLDTNILLYAALGRDHAGHRWERAREIVLTEDYCTSGQVLAEFYNNATRKGAPPLSSVKAREWVRVVAMKPCQPITSDVVVAGIDHARRYQLSYWDGAIIAAAERIGARVLYSEDLNHGQTYGSVRVENPFLPA
ncbi:PIN domain-containing protein [Brevundimonas aurifodinae]|uniref:PIN domain-containing protein n=2 Tax=Brevundimonas TaxID=41275 RepID=A0ABV1NIK4_9CAUL|nr:MAG: VapC toxin family PIN domain ribonuclease [Brevundimonas sp. 12-68-7]OYX35702.1 MAG: VapC toxin family PIN domain ribonuclease [Brevundimonas subvibrioides]